MDCDAKKIADYLANHICWVRNFEQFRANIEKEKAEAENNAANAEDLLKSMSEEEKIV